MEYGCTILVILYFLISIPSVIFAFAHSIVDLFLTIVVSVLYAHFVHEVLFRTCSSQLLDDSFTLKLFFHMAHWILCFVVV